MRPLAELRPTEPGAWRVLALQYASRMGLRGQHFLGHDPSSTEPHPTAYYVWVALGADDVVLVDAGISASRAAEMSGLSYRGSPVDLLGRMGIAPADVSWTVLTHLHYDHTGTLAELPATRYVVQQEEWDYWTGPWARRIRREHWLCSTADMDHLGRAREDGRVELVRGDREVLPGLSVHLVGGHTAGMQVVRVRTRSGPAVLASDASHFYENLDDDRPAPILHCMTGVYGAFDRVRTLADSPDLVVPGHDPAVLDRHPPLAREHEGEIALIA
ncbi:N-acyl homoserine lactonase family protein [Blastococcus montanus]|uniref:N-acyl homoserine lactonase family protein n=1 Tax=Blastococcus montanus TaxID=3144973 RepID=UPI003208BB51